MTMIKKLKLALFAGVFLGLLTGPDKPAFGQSSVVVTGTYDSNKDIVRAGDLANNAIRVNVVAGAGATGGTSQADNTTAGTITGIGFQYDTTPNAITDGNVGVPRMDSSRRAIIVCEAGCGGAAAFEDNDPFTVNTTSIANLGALVDDVASTTVTENSAGIPRMSSSRILYINPRSSGGTELGTSSNPMKTDPTGTTPQPVTGTFWQTTQPVSGSVTITSGTISLPVGAATEATLSTILLNATFTSRFPAGASPADNETNTNTNLSRIGNYNYVFDGTTWDRWTGAVSGTVSANQAGTWNITNITGTVSLPTGAATESTQATLLLNSTITSRMPSGTTPAENETNANSNLSRVGAYNYVFDGSTWDRLPGNSTSGVLVNLGANNAVTVTGTVTANAGTGNFTVVQPTGSNLHIVCDSGCSGGGGTTQYAEDTAIGAGDQVTMAGVVRMDTPGTLVNADQEHTQLQVNANGALRVDGSTVTQPVSGTVGISQTTTANDVDALVSNTATSNAIAVRCVDVTGSTFEACGGGGGGTGVILDGTGDSNQANVTSGRLHVDGSGVTQPISGTVTAIGSGTYTVVQPSGANLHIICDSGCTPGGSTSDSSSFTFGSTALNPMGAVVDDATTNTVAENSIATPRMNTNRILYQNLRNNAGTEIGIAGSPLRTDPTGTTTQPVSGTVTANAGSGTFTISGTVTANAGSNLNTSALALDATLTNRLPAGSTPADNESNAMQMTRMGVMNYIFDGATWDRWTGAVTVSSGTITANAGSGSFTVAQPTGSNLHIVCDSGCGGSPDTELPAATALSDAMANPTAPAVGAFNLCWNGTTWDRCRGSTLTQGSTTSGQAGVLNMGAVTTSAPSYTTAQTSPLSLQTDGSLRMACTAGCSGGTQYAEDTAIVEGDIVTMAGVVRKDTRGTLAGADQERTQLQVNSSGDLRVDGSAVTQPVSGTVTANAGTGTFYDGILRDGTGDTTQANVANGRLSVDGSAVTQPVSGTITANAGTGTFFDGINRDGTGDTTQANVSGGRLHVDGSGVTQPVSGTVTANAGTGNFTVIQSTGSNLHIVCDSGCTPGGSFADNAAFTFGTTAINNMGAVVDDTSTNTVTENSSGAPRMNTNRILYSNLRNNAGTEIGTSGTPIRTDPTGTTAQPVTGTFWQATQPISGTITANAGTNLNTSALVLDATVTGRWPSGTTPADNESNAITATRLGVYQYIFDGTTWDRWTGAISGTVTANAGTGTFFDGIVKDGTGDTTQANVTSGRLNVDGSGVTQPVSGTVTVGTFPDNEPINVAQVGGTAVGTHDGTTFEAPLTMSAYAETPEDSDANTNGNRVSADADKVRLLADRNGMLYTRNGPPHRWAYHENSSSALTDTTVHASCGTGLFNYIESVTASTNAATAFSIMIEDSTTATILGPYYLEAVAGRGLTVVYPGGRKQTNAATLISVTTTGAIAHSVDITGFCAP